MQSGNVTTNLHNPLFDNEKAFRREAESKAVGLCLPQIQDRQVIKCDTKGAEHSIFSGGQKFLRKFRPKLAVTTYHNDWHYRDMYDLLKSVGYKVQGNGLLFSPGDRGALRVMMIHAW